MLFKDNYFLGANVMQCDTCAFYIYDDEFEEYYCDIDMDEDDYGRLISSSREECPFYRNGDDYAVVRHQM